MISATHDSTTTLILEEEARLRRVARRLTRCEADAEDLVQDTLLRAYRARNRFEPGTSIRAWTGTILRRVFLTGVFRTKRRGLEYDSDAGEPIDRTAGSMMPTTSDRSPALPELLENVDDVVKHAVEHVPPIYLEPFLMAAIDDMSCSEIARQLGVPEGTVMSRIHRARQRLKSDLLHGLPTREAKLLSMQPILRRVRRQAVG